MSAQKVLAVSGEKKAGKTTLLEKLIPALARRGVRTAVIKHDGHGFYPDREGTDTNRVFAAGAVGAAVFDGEKFQVVKRVPVAVKKMPDASMELPYDGVLRASGTRLAPTGAERRPKEMILVDDVDNPEFLCKLIESMWEELPERKRKNPKKP